MSKNWCFFNFFYFLTLQYSIGFAIYQHETTTSIHVFPILNPPPFSLHIPSLWVVPVHQAQASSIMLWCWRRLLRVPFTARRSNQSILNKISSGYSFGSTNVKAETPILWLPDAKSWLIGKDPDAGKDWGQEEKRTMEDEMLGWHDWLNGHQFGWTRELVMDRKAWRAAVHGFSKSWIHLRNWTEYLNLKLLHIYSKFWS